MEDSDNICKPAKYCIFCGKTIAEIGGRRIIAQNSRGCTLSENPSQSKDRKYIPLSEANEAYLVIWGEDRLWTGEAVVRAKDAYLRGERPWFCQICGSRQCSTCGNPSYIPAGSDVINGDGKIVHYAMLGADTGCSNPRCKKGQRRKDNRVTSEAENPL